MALMRLLRPVSWNSAVGRDAELFLAERGYEVTGVDISPDAIAIARQLQAGDSCAPRIFRLRTMKRLFGTKRRLRRLSRRLHHAESETAALRLPMPRSSRVV